MEKKVGRLGKGSLLEASKESGLIRFTRDKVTGLLRGSGAIYDVLSKASKPLSLLEISDRTRRRRDVKVLIARKVEGKPDGALFFDKKEGKKGISREEKLLKFGIKDRISVNSSGSLIRGSVGVPLISRTETEKGITKYFLTPLSELIPDSDRE